MMPKYHSFHIRLPLSLHQAVASRAKAEGVSYNAWLMSVIAAAHPGWVPTRDENGEEEKR